jgi:hypothetical protein
MERGPQWHLVQIAVPCRSRPPATPVPVITRARVGSEEDGKRANQEEKGKNQKAFHTSSMDRFDDKHKSEYH